MDDNKDAIRLNTVRRVDAHAVKIVDSASRTALYSYEEDGEEWSKTEVEGTFMLYSREAPPYNMITIINRLNKTNFIEALTPTCDIQVKPPYLLFRNPKAVIYGIWFSEQDDVHRISSAIEARISPKSNNVPPTKTVPNLLNDPAIAVASSGTGDIMSMLSRAHGEFTFKHHDPSCGDPSVNPSVAELSKPSLLKSSLNNTNSPNVVADFIAKVGGVPGSAAGHVTQTPTTLPLSGTSPSSSDPMLQKLFQGAAAIGGQACVIGSKNTPTTAPMAIPGAPLAQSNPVSSSSSVPSGAPMSLQELEGRLKENLHINARDDEPNLTPFKVSTITPSQPKVSDPTSLLAPQVFTSHRPNDGSSDNICIHSFNSFMNATSGGKVEPRPNPPLNGIDSSAGDVIVHRSSLSNETQLTQEQLVQAFTILLKREDFVQQLHGAYVQALNQSYKGCL